MARLAAQWSHDLAEEELAKVAKVHAELEQLGQRLPDGWRADRGRAQAHRSGAATIAATAIRDERMPRRSAPCGRCAS